MTDRAVANVSQVIFVLALGLSLAPPAAAEGTPEAYLDLLRGDIRATKKTILEEALDLSPAHAEAFWPIYDDYEVELTAYFDRRIEVIERFIDNWGAIDDDEAGDFAKDFFTLQTDRIKMLKTYHKKVAKATSPLVAARFVQAENLIGKMTDLQIASELPLIE